MNEEQFPRRAEHDGFFCRFTFGQFFAILLLEVFTLFFIFYLGARYGREFFSLGISNAGQVTVVHDNGAVPANVDPTVVSSEDPAALAMADDLIAKAGTPELKEKIATMLKNQNAIPEMITQANQVAPVVPAQGLGQGVVVVGNSPSGTAPTQAQVATTPQTPVVNPSSSKVTVITADGETKTLDEAAAYQQYGQGTAPALNPSTTEVARYSIQIGSYPQLELANQAVENWKGKGYPAYMMIADIPEKGRWYRVRIGGFSEKTKADSYLSELASREKVDALVVYNDEQ